MQNQEFVKLIFLDFSTDIRYIAIVINTLSTFTVNL